MLELENFGVVEMSSQEIQEVDGGNWMEFLYQLADHWDQVTAGFSAGWHSTHP